MLADGLNKGKVSRDALRLMCASGRWLVDHKFETYSSRCDTDLVDDNNA